MIYQLPQDTNAVWHTDENLVCSRCGKTSREGFLEIDGKLACWGWDRKKPCWNFLLQKELAVKESVQIRLIVPEDNTIRKKRDPVGLALRWKVLKRDRFQCAICGCSGKDARLEIDHKLPVSAGGKNEATNLRVLCFNCNRGKKDGMD
jgi:5-methylcytosine-specific restriction endonuclease McrA